MIRNLLLTLCCLLLTTLVMAQTSLQGKVTDDDGELIGANITVYKNGVFSTGVVTDYDGNYSINLDPGTYDVEISYVGYPATRTAGVLVKAGQVNKLDVKLEQGTTLEEVVVVDYKVPLVEQDNTTTGKTLTSEEIRNLPTKSVTALAATAAGLSQSDEGDALRVRGSRADATDYYVDGIRVSGLAIPQSEIDQMQVITGGIEAQYGDVTGGVISITTKGPSRFYSGGLEVETSEYLDSYGYNLVSGNLSGPILKKENGEAIIGFRVSGQFITRKDDDPPAVNVFQVKPEKYEELKANPITTIGTSKIPSAEFLTNDDVNALDYRPGERNTDINVTAKLDARLTRNIDVTLTGAYVDNENMFTPFTNREGNYRLLNSFNNPTNMSNRYRGNFRFRHRLGGGGFQAEEGAEAGKPSLIQNLQYILQFGYEKSTSEVGDPIHQERLFDYGYVGNYDFNYVPVVDFVDGEVRHIDNREEFVGYTPGTQNPILTNYNNVSDIANFNDLVARNGLFVGPVQQVWSYHANIGQVYNTFSKSDNDRLTANITSSFELVPGGDKGRHYLQFGIIYEQRFNRGYGIAPRGLWNIARQQANRHILGVDTTNVIGIDSIETPFGFQTYDLYGLRTVDQPELLFYKKIREATNTPIDQWINIDGLDPNTLRLDMFSAQELNDLGIVGYSGFDYLGNKLGDDVTFDDFFTAEENGIRTFPVAAFNPIYAAAYLQDKFTYKDIIFRLGVRMDYYDANTKVLKDPYSLYQIQTAGDFYNQIAKPIPAGVDPSYNVYVAGEGSSVVTAFRDGDQWFFPNGTPANDGNVIFGGQVVTPRLADPEASNIRARGYNTNLSFEDYEPQINWMPRLAFSFPISDAANFFAHYDILVQRPPSNVLASALDYYYFEDRPGSDNNPFNNPNLKPERTIDYEVGFNQRLTQSSAIKISAYYKEMRDMIQLRTFLYVPSPVNNYVTYDNLDFGTVKGFSFQYDLRRTGNVTLQANYTLQFADGTGSGTTSQRGLTSRGNLRTLFPLSFDERHRINAILDYRYSKGKYYNGPRLFGKDILANAGANVQMIAVSGRPFTAKQIPSKRGGSGTVGQINGSRLPWNFSINLRVDKSFNLVTRGEGKRPLNLNVYLRVQNLLDRRNTIGVYPATGSPSDDGYLASSFGQDEVEQVVAAGKSLDAFLASYQWSLLNPNLYSIPRRIYLGAIFEF